MYLFIYLVYVEDEYFWISMFMTNQNKITKLLRNFLCRINTVNKSSLYAFEFYLAPSPPLPKKSSF